jgi:hypothetical protein
MMIPIEQLYKLGRVLPEEQKYEHNNIWTIETTTGPERLALGVVTSHVDYLLKLTKVMREPFWLLYILTVSRCGHTPGRYQSDISKTREEMEKFLITFRSFLENDGRHHLWIGSESGPELLVYDRHNIIYAYGPIDQFSAILVGDGLTLSSDVSISSPHSHHYHQAFDPEEDALMAHWEWQQFPLADSDDD